MNNHSMPLEPIARTSALESEKAPMHIGFVSLLVRDIDRLVAFYGQTIGLDIIEQRAGRVTLGSGGTGYLHLIAAPHATAPKPNASGLFHTAFLLPSRSRLGAWFKGAIDRDAPVEAASDHLVSEAFYLSDPEGNGIEVYADRDRSHWQREGSGYAMTTARMDVNAVIAEGESLGLTDGRFPAESRIGHVHLSVGDLAAAEGFYAGAVGLDVTAKRPGGIFYSSGGYHHHIATNIWHSKNAPPRDAETTGLAEVAFTVKDDAIMARLRTALGKKGSDEATIVARDPWAIPLSFHRETGQMGPS